MAFKGRPTYAIIFVAVSTLYLCATFVPLCYSALFPNQDIQSVIAALKPGGYAPLDGESAIQEAKAAVGSLTREIQVGYYTGMTAKIHYAGAQPNERTRVSQATYVAWFQKRSRPMLVQITLYANERGQKAFRITEAEPVLLVRGYGVPILLFGLSLFVLRRTKKPATAAGKL